MEFGIKFFVERIAAATPFVKTVDGSKTGGYTSSKFELSHYGIVTPDQVQEFVDLLQAAWDFNNGPGERLYKISDFYQTFPDALVLKWAPPILTKTVYKAMFDKLQRGSYDRKKVTAIFTMDNELYKLAANISGTFIELGANPESTKIDIKMDTIMNCYLNMFYKFFIGPRTEFPSYNDHHL